MGLTEIIDTDVCLYWVGGRTAVGLRPAAPERADEPFDPTRCGLHHVCFRARSREDVDSVHALAVSLGAKIVHPPEESGFVPGHYSVLSDIIRLEVNFVPGKGVFESR
jgi:catechol 2,3-dioxygenase-like lactoylglutathione lyase family enzyme